MRDGTHKSGYDFHLTEENKQQAENLMEALQDKWNKKEVQAKEGDARGNKDAEENENEGNEEEEDEDEDEENEDKNESESDDGDEEEEEEDS